MVFKYLSLCILALCIASCTAQSLTLPPGTPLPVQINDHLPMRVGEPIRARLIYPVYADNTLLLPANTIVLGTVTELRADHAHRVSARLRADFTPFRIPIVHFTGIILADGTTLPITTSTATDGAPVSALSPLRHAKAASSINNGTTVFRFFATRSPSLPARTRRIA